MVDAVEHTLCNGLRVLVVPLAHLHTVAMGVSVRAGPRFETVEENGLSHLVEHLLFRGTQRHPSSFAFHSAVEELGGEINGMTQRDAITVHLSVPRGCESRAIRLLGDLTCRPTLDGLDIERGVVIEEILDTQDAEGGELDLDTISRAGLWGPHPIAAPVAGSVDNVDGFTARDCHAFYRRVFTAANAVLVVAGPVDPQQIFESAAGAFGGLPRGRRLVDLHPPSPPAGAPIQVRENDDAQVTLLMTYPAPSERDPDFAALSLLRRILDDGFASRLRQEICEKRGLAYSVAATLDVYSDVGALDIEATCSPAKVLRTVTHVLATLSRLANDGVEARELERAKARFRADQLFNLDDAPTVCGWYASAGLLRPSPSLSERQRQVEAVTSDQLRALAERMFHRDALLMTVIGPVELEHVEPLAQMIGRDAESSVWLSAEDEEEATDDEPTDVLPGQIALRLVVGGHPIGG